MELLLTLISGIAWTIVYIELIRTGFKYKTYGMPLFALGLNLAWEMIYSFDALSHGIGVQGTVNLVWMLLDIVILVTYFMYGRKHYIGDAKKYFIPWSILALISCALIQFAFYFEFRGIAAAEYSAFAQNAAMSILFVVMLMSRKDTDGQNLRIAIAKWVGTLAPTILMGLLQKFSIYILLMGIICCLFDMLYIFLLNKRKAEERAS